MILMDRTRLDIPRDSFKMEILAQSFGRDKGNGRGARGPTALERYPARSLSSDHGAASKALGKIQLL